MSLKVVKTFSGQNLGQLQVSHRGTTQLGGEMLSVGTAFQPAPQQNLRVSGAPLHGGTMISPMDSKANGGRYQATMRVTKGK